MRERSDVAAEVVEGKGDSLLAQPAHEWRDAAEVRARSLLGEFKPEGSGFDAALAHQVFQHSPELRVGEGGHRQIQGEFSRVPAQQITAGRETLDRVLDAPAIATPGPVLPTAPQFFWTN